MLQRLDVLWASPRNPVTAGWILSSRQATPGRKWILGGLRSSVFPSSGIVVVWETSPPMSSPSPLVLRNWWFVPCK